MLTDFLLFLNRLVVWRLWPIKPQRNVLLPRATCGQTQRHQVALLQGPQLLAPRHHHDDPTPGLLIMTPPFHTRAPSESSRTVLLSGILRLHWTRLASLILPGGKWHFCLITSLQELDGGIFGGSGSLFLSWWRFCHGRCFSSSGLLEDKLGSVIFTSEVWTSSAIHFSPLDERTTVPAFDGMWLAFGLFGGYGRSANSLHLEGHWETKREIVLSFFFVTWMMKLHNYLWDMRYYFIFYAFFCIPVI